MLATIALELTVYNTVITPNGVIMPYGHIARVAYECKHSR